ncbi:hypothetical protein CHS0354_005713 [Potamilus streckersoni]|uniref:BTB domain-containing protein n=1 Tax=Potamilus streckersoni TaxID=2493646 RepID=A0AAE0VK02_9BIVA|nr:hypothetical protein CHS0354_005713 [Potamilus streckersoni]
MDSSFRIKYLQSLSQGIAEIHHNKRYTDVIISVDETKFECHKLILGAMSHYFNAMFSTQMNESRDEVITIQNVDKDTFKTLLKYIYTGDDLITMENVQNLLRVANMLQVECLQEHCENFLNKILSAENCLSIWKMASAIGCLKLVRKTWNYILENFVIIMEFDEFDSLDVNDIISLIRDNDLNTSSEEVVYDAVIKWIQANPEERKSQIDNLLTHIRFPFISTKYINEHKDIKILTNSMYFQELMKDFPIRTNENDSNLINSRIFQPHQYQHRQEQVLCIVGIRSRHPNPQQTELKCFSYRRDSEYVMAKLPVEPGACFAVCCTKEDVYLSGGYHGQTLFLHYNGITNTWQQCEGLKEGRWGHDMVLLNGNVYSIGGSSRSSQTLSSIECYTPQNNHNEIVGNLSLPVSFMASAAIKNKIFIFGGMLQDRTFSQNIQCFDIENRTCKIVGSMPEMTTSASRVVVIENAVYIFYRGSDIMMYTEESGLTKVGTMPEFDHYGVVHHNGLILIVGCRNNQYSSLAFNPVSRKITEYIQTFKAAMCGYHCMNLVISKQHMKSAESDDISDQKETGILQG